MIIHRLKCSLRLIKTIIDETLCQTHIVRCPNLIDSITLLILVSFLKEFHLYRLSFLFVPKKLEPNFRAWTTYIDCKFPIAKQPKTRRWKLLSVLNLATISFAKGIETVSNTYYGRNVTIGIGLGFFYIAFAFLLVPPSFISSSYSSSSQLLLLSLMWCHHSCRFLPFLLFLVNDYNFIVLYSIINLFMLHKFVNV